MARHGAAALTPVAEALQTACFCGRVTVQISANSAPLACSVCHCRTCRALSGAPHLANLVFPAASVEVLAPEEDGPALLTTETSKHVTRKRCPSCFSPVCAQLGPKRMVVPLALFERSQIPADWCPQHHLYYERRVVDAIDALPKYVPYCVWW
eukprot:TRINITY_DN37482_c0_g1_i1.p2 TRINITY_DN37482_c0_g1~~TRINITY_DN37482_c0_g1_i1.p2  ORF type:complete len:153 (+),score=17.27 TRINITY_DN37482_c0_g1_i1:159-617(+)